MALPALMELESTEDVFLQDDLGPTIAEHASQCSHLFNKCMAIPKIVPDPTLMDDQMARFTLWASNMDVFGPLNVSLDYRLRYSPNVVQIIHQLLDVIYNTLTSLKAIDDPPETPSRKKRRLSESGNAEVTERADDDSSDSGGDEDQTERNVSLVTYIIGGTVTRLFRLSNAIRKSAKASRTCKIGGYRDDEEANNAITELRLYTECYVRFRFPQAPEALRSALVQANALRLRRLYYQRSHRRRIALSVQRPQADQKSNRLPNIPVSAPVVRFASNAPPKPRGVEVSKPTGLPPAPTTYATTARQTAVGALYADSTVEIPRAKSVLVNNKLSFPPVPTTNECPYCGVIVEFEGATKTIMWNDHVIRDLEPFVCIFPHCTDSSQQDPGSLTFETSNAWMSHMHTAHGYAWECRAPSHDPIIFEQEAEFQDHSRTEHGVPEAHVGTLSRAARRPVHGKILECPFGDDFSAPEKAELHSVRSNEALLQHVAAHMKEIALLALQKLPGDDDDRSEDVASDAPIEEDGFAKLRGSMYSILDDEALDFLDEAGNGISNTLEEGISSSVERLDLEDKDTAGMTKLHRAVRDNSLPLVQSLIEQGANLRSRTNRGETALHYATLNGDEGLDVMSLLLAFFEAQEIINLQDDNSQTPVHYAAKRGFIKGIRLLADYGAFMNIFDNNGLSPYIWAVIASDYDAVCALLSLGVDVNSTSADGRSALGWAASLGYTSIITLLVERGANVMSMTNKTQSVPLEEAAAFGTFSAVSALLRSGADANYRDREGWSAIHWAAEEGYSEIVKLLLDHGADANAASSYGTSPLHCAANGGHNQIVSLLLQHGADPLKSTCHGWTPLHHAAFMGHSRVVQSLLQDDRIISTPLQDNHGWSVLHLAVYGRHLETVKVLLDSPIISGSRIQGDERGFTAQDWLDFEFGSHYYKTISNLAFGKSRCCRATTGLTQAVHNGNIVLTEYLLERGYQVNNSDSGRRTALYYAAKKGHIPILNMLLEKGANPNILPTGLRTWEDFISDDAVLQQLRQGGYTKPILNPEIDHQIKLALRVQGEVPTLGESVSQNSVATASREDEPVNQAGEPRSRVTRFWKRLRGQ